MYQKISIASEQQTVDLLKQFYGKDQRKRRIYAHYSTLFNKIITDEHLMLIPVDERMAVRAHAVFDVIYVKKLAIINLESHITRLIKSAESVQIKVPISHHQIKQIVHKVMSELMKKMILQGSTKQSLANVVFGVRLTISSGFGDFGIASIDKQPIFYLTVFEPYFNYEKQKEGVNEFVVKLVKQPKQFVHAKVVNYVDNAIMANQSKKKGGYQGIKALESGVLLEASVANIAFIFGRQFATPRFETVIQGTTIKKLLKYVLKLKQQGLIENVSMRDITIQEVESKANEMMVIGGDKIVPVLNFNGKQISKQKGNFTRMFQEWYEKENETSEPIKL